MRTDHPRPTQDAQEVIEALQNRCCALIHHPALAALLACLFPGLFGKRR